jgi:hypothetical protein
MNDRFKVEYWPLLDGQPHTDTDKSGVMVTDLKTGATAYCNRYRHPLANRQDAIALLVLQQKNA